MEKCSESQKRQYALELYRQGVKVSEICRSLNRSRTWFYKWLRRNESGDPNWNLDRSKAPCHIANKTSKELVTLILEIRSGLETTPGSCIGAGQIQTRMRDLGWNPPSKRCINRILKQHRMTHGRRRTERHTKRRKRRKPSRRKQATPPGQLSLF